MAILNRQSFNNRAKSKLVSDFKIKSITNMQLYKPKQNYVCELVGGHGVKRMITVWEQTFCNRVQSGQMLKCETEHDSLVFS